MQNEYSINLPAQYNLKGKITSSLINFINPMRGLLMGSPGAGKSYFIIQHIIKQHIEKGFSMFILMGNIISGQVSGDTANFYQKNLGVLCRTGKAFPSTAMTPR